ncbi:redox-regulated ATPase YchF [Thiospirochaeta perfilievii]|uniref:Ribosome-binding ATPase YchF n=1 Tax=Thiospirochaeta perfilievii TaxID=252967 RepID=A0A5C1QB49_9SPIO|nr:redox-regulated ATPase YchF [Thiospirochaeta perfilievii]QEN04026.1 redox-regulated ATPase YchF [Thiospirochaeta perfilievii]
MGLNCGIVGLPNVGKSTIFSALTSAPAEAANYPFCTIDPNVGVVDIPDKRLKKISEFIPPQKLIPASVEFVDIAGLVKGASKGEGLGNKFLANIREVGVIIHVVRCFDDADVIHVDNKIDPASDIETINLELAFSDLDTVEKRMQKTIKLVRANDADAKKLMPILERLKEALENGKPARTLEFTDSERELVRSLHLITMKKVLYVCNIDESALHEDNDYVKVVREIAEKESARAIKICGQLEAEIAELETDEEKEEFLSDAGLEESGLSHLIHEGYNMLGLRTYFTAGDIEVRAWTYKDGDKAPQAAGVIHTDFEKGFIKAEVYHCEDLFELHTEANIKSKGKLRIEGKEYVVKDGDVMHFRFNV